MPDDRLLAARGLIQMAGFLLGDSHPDDAGARQEAAALLRDAIANAEALADELEATDA